MSIFLETERLVLRVPKLCDLDTLVTLRSDFEVMQYTGEGGAQTKEQVQDYLNFAISYHKKHGLGFYLVFEKESGSFVGEAGLFHCYLMTLSPKLKSIIIYTKSSGEKAMLLN
ncbi:nucleotidyltransferase PLUS glutamate rich protein GrpB PLUS ribosomal protein alanine acetyltransferase [Legionella gratiana]|uniref:Nucleotidyltransferase PLUS glutamate rich protein GrpB PLUS ribosomal protein alanine acetyltransferase n=1 Tax=Legionella gratiana TaxID=45066 RepID=A0A378JAY2_9GAMM|nr:GNAT family N-acetyltransferase [Legionella gratiana]STX44047.1 nucleotidyltransferase PLUS glutamate rich protein GrpB PLUS ribosomal protein alanine acetyltransferase [Legionella gratiana]